MLVEVVIAVMVINNNILQMILIIRMVQRGRSCKTARYPSNLLWRYPLLEVVPVYFLLLSMMMKGKQFLVSPPMQVLGAFGLQPACSGWQGRVQAGDGSLGVLRTKHPLRHPSHDTCSNVHTRPTIPATPGDPWVVLTQYAILDSGESNHTVPPLLWYML